MHYFKPIRNRKCNRLKYYDYSRTGYYFVTICTKDRMWDFGQIKNEKMVLNDIGRLCHRFWLDMPEHYINVDIDEFVVMPNHIHGIIIIEYIKNVGTGQCPVPTGDFPKYGLLSKVVKSFKEVVVKTRRNKYDNYDFKWQRSFHDRIIRNKKELYFIQKYIRNNPMNWKRDRNKRNVLWM